MTTSPKPQRAPKPPKAIKPVRVMLCKAGTYGEVYQPHPQGDCLIIPDGAPLPLPPAVQRVLQMVPFLLGEASLDGHWFGDPPPGHGRFWWRSKLRKRAAAIDAISPPVRGGRGRR